MLQFVPFSVRRTLSFLLLALLVAAMMTGCRREKPDALSSRSEGAPVIVISIDTLRADRLPTYGYAKVETPALSAFEKDAITFENAYAHVPLTLPSHVSMLTGLLPAENGVRNNLGYRFDAKTPSLPTLLKQSGYQTGGAVSAYVLRRATGLGDAFDFYDDAMRFQGGTDLGDLQRPGEETLSVSQKWIAENSTKPFFYFFHIFEPHTPYEAPEPFRTRYASQPYDAEVAASDDIVGRFLESLKSSGVYDRALIIVLSDHGEGLGDHGEQEHGIFLYREAIHVPLLVKLPGNRDGGKRVVSPVQLIDIVPTVAEVTGFTPPANLKGKSLLQLSSKPESRRIFSETMYPRIHLGLSDLRSLVDDEFHFIEAPKPELYSVKNDPGEKTNVLEQQRRVYARFREEMSAFPRELAAPTNISKEDAEKLAALGYIGSASATPKPSDRDPKEFIVELERMKEASQLAAAGNIGPAIKTLEEIVGKHPEYTDAWATLAKVLEQTGQLERAEAAYRRVLTLSPSMIDETALSLASIYLNLGKLDQARAHAELAINHNPGAARLLLGRVALAERNYAAAEQQARSALEDEHYRIQAQVLLAQVLAKTNRAAEALSIAEAAQREVAERKLRPVRLLEFARGDALARIGRIPEAQQAFRKEIALFPHDRQTYAHLAALFLLEGKKREADEVLEQLVRKNPGRASVQLAYDTYARLGDPRTAAMWKGRLASAGQAN